MDERIPTSGVWQDGFLPVEYMAGRIPTSGVWPDSYHGFLPVAFRSTRTSPVFNLYFLCQQE